MENLLNPEVTAQVKDYLAPMKGAITLVLFTKEAPCNTCDETRQLLTEVSSLTEKITLVEKNIAEDEADASAYGISLTPSFVILDAAGDYQGVKFNGIPAGHEINSFLSALMDMSGIDFGFDKVLGQRLDDLTEKVNIKVFVTLSCPHCPGAVSNAHRLAMSHPNIESEMIEANTFGEISQKYNVSGVPKIIINDTHELVGNQPIQEYLKTIEAL